MPRNFTLSDQKRCHFEIEHLQTGENTHMHMYMRADSYDDGMRSSNGESNEPANDRGLGERALLP